MRPFFADTSYFLALLNETDPHHAAASEIGGEWLGRLVVTEYVLVELGNALSRGNARKLFPPLVRDCWKSPQTRLVEASTRLFQLGVQLYASRHDKNWSFVDCISFIVMKEHRLTDALTTDHHFEQAGFRALLR